MIVESVNAKGKGKESAVWLYFEKTEERSGGMFTVLELSSLGY